MESDKLKELLKKHQCPMPKETFELKDSGLSIYHTGLDSTNPMLDPCMGIDVDPLRAELKAGMETLERFFLRKILIAPELYFYSKSQELVQPLVVPCPYSDFQRENFPEIQKALLTDDKTGIEAFDLLSERRQSVIPFNILASKTGPTFYEASSNGWAIGDDKTLEERAILEAIERDAFLTSWWTRTPPVRVKAPEELGLYQSLSSWCAVRGGSLDLMMFPSDSSAYVFGAALKSKGYPLPFFMIGLGADLDATQAANKALRELAGLLSVPLAPKLTAKYYLPDSFDRNVFTLAHHLMFYALWPQVAAYGFLYESVKEVFIGDLKAKNLGEIFSSLKEMGHELYLLEPRNALLNTDGLRLTKAFSSTLIPLDIHHRRRALGHPRLKDNFKNIYPHPIG